MIMLGIIVWLGLGFLGCVINISTYSGDVTLTDVVMTILLTPLGLFTFLGVLFALIMEKGSDIVIIKRGE